MPVSTSVAHSLKEAFASIMGLPENTDWHSVHYGTTGAWDSMAHMQLVTEMESRFNIRLSTDEVIGLDSFAKAQQIVESHGVVS